jgi:hypothetical protein
MSKKLSAKKSKSQIKNEPKFDRNFSNSMIKDMSKMRLSMPENQKDTKSDMTVKFLNISIATKDLIDLGIDIWRMEQRLNKVVQSLPENSQDLLNNSIQKIKRYLDKNDIEIVDHTNQKYNDGRNLDVLAVENSSDILESIIKETKEPTILHKNQVVHKGKVIVLEKNSENSKHD